MLEFSINKGIKRRKMILIKTTYHTSSVKFLAPKIGIGKYIIATENIATIKIYNKEYIVKMPNSFIDLLLFIDCYYSFNLPPLCE